VESPTRHHFGHSRTRHHSDPNFGPFPTPTRSLLSPVHRPAALWLTTTRVLLARDPVCERGRPSEGVIREQGRVYQSSRNRGTALPTRHHFGHSRTRHHSDPNFGPFPTPTRSLLSPCWIGGTDWS
jgi:hypothetical protein